MKHTFLLLIYFLMACQQREQTGNESLAETSDSLPGYTAEVEETRNYTGLYGQYLHESNTTGFTALLELTPQGNDLAFTLSLLQGNCEASLDGTISMVYHGEQEYAGFFDSEPCRLAFNFFLIENKVRVDEIGLCRAHPIGCSFAGTYGKSTPAE